MLTRGGVVLGATQGRGFTGNKIAGSKWASNGITFPDTGNTERSARNRKLLASVELSSRTHQTPEFRQNRSRS